MTDEEIDALDAELAARFEERADKRRRDAEEASDKRARMMVRAGIAGKLLAVVAEEMGSDAAGAFVSEVVELADALIAELNK